MLLEISAQIMIARSWFREVLQAYVPGSHAHRWPCRIPVSCGVRPGHSVHVLLVSPTKFILNNHSHISCQTIESCSTLLDLTSTLKSPTSHSYMSPLPSLPASPNLMFRKSQASQLDLAHELRHSSTKTSEAEQQRLAAKPPVQTSEQPPSSSFTPDLSRRPATFQEAQKALMTVLRFLEQDQMLQKFPDKILSEGEIDTIRGLAEDLGHRRLNADEDNGCRR